MKALILIGGYGTRLRPLTLTVPKPLVDFGDKPILCHQIHALANAGVTEVILAVNNLPPELLNSLKGFEDTYKIKISISIENEPMGTAGPIRLAKDLILKDNTSGMFFVFNSDVICDYPLDKFVEFHKQHGHEGTLLTTMVEDPTRYGVIISKENGQIEKFVEKPTVFVSNKINAGLYLLNVSMIDRVEMRPTSIEREIFPLMAADGELYQMSLDGYWMDIGQPKDYLIGQKLFLQSKRDKGNEDLAKGANIIGDVYIHPNAQVDPTSQLGPNVIIGDGCKIGPGNKISDSTILPQTVIKGYSLVQGSIIGWKNVIGRWVRISGLTVTGEDVDIKDELFLNGSMILPHKPITISYPIPGAIVM